MGVNAYVPCNCRERGLTTPEPTPVELANGRVVPLDPEIDPERRAAFDEWRRTACSHPNLLAVDEEVATWDHVRALTAALETYGSPVALLASVLPRVNGGSVDPTASSLCMKELEAFRELSIRRTPHLVDTGADKVIHGREGVFFEAQGGDVGYDAYGFFVADRRALETRPVEERIRFRAKHVYVTPSANGCEVRDLDSNATTTCLWDPPGTCDLAVIMKAVEDPQFVGILDTLERLFTASVLWSTSVYWY